MNIFASGLKVNNGISYRPSITFIEDMTSGFYRKSDGVIGVSARGAPVMEWSLNNITIFRGLNIKQGAKDNSFLMGDKEGNVRWSSSPILSGSFKWNELYKKISPSSLGDNNVKTIQHSALNNVSNVVFSLESNNPITDNSFYIKNKNLTSFDIYSDLPLYKNIIQYEIDDISVCRLSNNNIALCYYNIDLDRVYYVHSNDPLGKTWADPVLIDNVSSLGYIDMKIVNNHPAVVYIYDNDDADEWRFVRASDENGETWNTPITLAVSDKDLNFISLSLNLEILNGNPACIYNDENGKAKIIRSSDSNGISWNNSVDISNLVNHQILCTKIINENLVVIAKSNILHSVYYVRANNAEGSSWPLGAVQLYKNTSDGIIVNSGDTVCDIQLISDKTYIVISELTTNNIYYTISSDNGQSWTGFTQIGNSENLVNTASPDIKFFNNNGNDYIMFNNSSGILSNKSAAIVTENHINVDSNLVLPVLNNYSRHRIIKNINDNNNIVFCVSGNNLGFFRFYENDFKLNWVIHSN